MNFSLRPAAPSDRAFIWSLRQATMRPLIDPLLGWDEPVQRGYADESLAGRIALVEGVAAGVLTVSDWPREKHLTWVAVRLDLQGRGLGSALVGRAQDEAAAVGLPLSLQVLGASPAVRLYRRLGFEAVAVESLAPGVERLRMRWQAAGA